MTNTGMSSCPLTINMYANPNDAILKLPCGRVDALLQVARDKIESETGTTFGWEPGSRTGEFLLYVSTPKPTREVWEVVAKVLTEKLRLRVYVVDSEQSP